ncbi:endoplasmic reticulum Oxidoreductin 1-domain-containing protein [Chytridium lagenaria]|nr:endoplasmic reticulum Oxidoreductin 1-domain-containing protein [Chytridium lagenaria]
MPSWMRCSSSKRRHLAMAVMILPAFAQQSWATTLQQSSQQTKPNYCSPNGAIQDTFCEFETVDSVNGKIFSLVDLRKDCPFWQEDLLCVQKDCAVQEVTDESEIPPEWKAGALSTVDFSTMDQSFGLFQKKCEYTDKDFCVVDDDSSSDGVYVDLLKNPERFTGYAGDSAARVWRAVYTENCFDTAESSGSFPGNDGQCMEKRVFYRLISGLHSSISTHICDKSLNRKTGEWYPDLECFLFRVGRFPDRVENLYFAYVVLLRSIAKLAPYLKSYKWCTGIFSDRKKIESLIEQIVEQSLSAPSTFDEKLMFADSSSKALKDEFKLHFRNVSRIMDCVGCEKCRLWGKLQVSGFGTALKILFSFGDNPKDFKLSRSELVALINGFGRLSDSIEAMNRFRKQMDIEEQERGATTDEEEDATLAAAVNKKLLLGLSALDLSYTAFLDPRFFLSWVVGLLLFVLGLARVIQKGYQMEKGTMKLPEGYKENSKPFEEEPVENGAEAAEIPRNGAVNGHGKNKKA